MNRQLTQEWAAPLLGAAVLILALWACNAPSPPPQDQAPPTASPNIDGPASAPTRTPTKEHRIGVRTVDGEAEFYDKQTGERFVPRGANFWRWVRYPVPGQGPQLMDATFNTDYGELEQAKAQLPILHASGYNTIRVWINACWGGSPGCMEGGSGLREEYLRNVADFLWAAHDNELYVIFTGDDLPDGGGYRVRMNSDCCNRFGSYNLHYLSSAGVEANRLYFHDLAQGLIDVGAPMDAILAYELRNETYFEDQFPPLSNTSGTAETANGLTYDMSLQAERQQMLEDGLLYWTDAMVAAIKEVDPTALVALGFFLPEDPNILRGPDDPRRVVVDSIMQQSTVDFIDYHAYPGFGTRFQAIVENARMEGYTAKPVILGEFGAIRSAYPDVHNAALVLQAWQMDACRAGFDGFLMWTWGAGDVNDDFWEAVDEGDVIRDALAPAVNPDPCVPGAEMLTGDLAFGKSVSASSVAVPPGSFPLSPENAVDLSYESYWNSNSGPPQWIEIDLQNAVTIARLHLVTRLPGTGQHVDRVWIKGPGTGGAYELLTTLDQNTSNEHVYEVTYDLPTPREGIQFIKVENVVHPGWVGWHEIEVYGP